MTGSDEPAPLREALKRVAVVCKQAGVPFALAGGYAAYARGGPEPDHDVDFVVLPSAVEPAKRAVADAGLRVGQPAEDWLFKVWCGDPASPAMVDVVHAVGGVPVDEAMIERADVLEVLAVRMPVLSATDILATKLRVLKEHYCDFSGLLQVARALREQVDWTRVRADSAGNPYAEAFLFLADRLELTTAARVA